MKLLINCQQRSDQRKNIKQIEKTSMVVQLIFIKLLVNYQDLRQVTPGKYKYMGPYNPLHEQLLEHDKNTGEVTKWRVQPHNTIDAIAAHHDICYEMGKKL